MSDRLFSGEGKELFHLSLELMKRQGLEDFADKVKNAYKDYVENPNKKTRKVFKDAWSEVGKRVDEKLGDKDE